MPGKRFQNVLDDFQSISLDFKLNELGLKVEARLNDEWLLLDQYVEAEVRTELRELGYSVNGKKKPSRQATKDYILAHARRNMYNPIKEYFQELRAMPYSPRRNEHGGYEPWNIPSFARLYFPDNPDGMFPTWLFKWTVGAIAKVYKQERNPILVMGGAEDIGKSTFVKWYCPLEEYHREGPIRPDSKDERLRLADTFIQEIPELGNTTRKTDVDAFKDHITKKSIVERPPYGGGPTRMAAICSFIATVNPDGAGFLVSTTGNTRFIVCEVNEIDFKYMEQNVNMLWREALWFYDNTYRAWELSPPEKRRRDEINAQYQMVSALDEIIDEHLEITGKDSDWMSTLEIMKALAAHYKTSNENGFARELSRLLKMRGIKSCREPYEEGKPHRRGWSGVKIRGITVKLE